MRSAAALLSVILLSTACGSSNEPQTTQPPPASTAPTPPVPEQLGKQFMEGVEAEGTRTTVTIPAGQIGNGLPITIVSERWFSPELQVLVMSRQSDPRFGETTYRLTNITRGEPSADLFEVPADFTVAEPNGQRDVIIRREIRKP